MDLGLKNRVAIVTGSSRGIGKAIAKSMAMEGTKVTICARNEDELMETSKEIEYSTGSEVLPIQGDLEKKQDIRSLIEETVQNFEHIDILVNNIGGPHSSLFLETSEQEWHSSVNSLLMSVIHCCKEVIPHMRKGKWGRIVNMTSFVAKQPTERLGLSNTIRAGVLGLTKTLSNELAKYDILVNAVCPGWTHTRRVNELARSTAEKTGKTYQDVIEEWSDGIALKRLAQPEEIAHIVVFLSSEKASYITGAVMQVDGGLIKSLL